MSTQQVIFASEAEAYVESLELLSLEEVGSRKWINQHEKLEKLNMQALWNASKNEDEFVKEMLISHDKVKLLVADVIIIDVWKNKIFPKIKEKLKESKASFPFYFLLYHELTVVTLLETILYHKSSCEAIDQVSLDLIQYSYQKILILKKSDHFCEKNENIEESKLLGDSIPDELDIQNKKIDFMVGVKCLGVMRFLIEGLEILGLSAAKHIYSTLDVPLLMVSLLEEPPWICQHKEKMRNFDGNKWVESDEKISKMEGQVWISLFQLLLTNQRENYNFSSHRKGILMRLRPHLTDVLIDQLPVLVELQRFLDQLSLFNPESASSSLVLEQLPQIKNEILKKLKGKVIQIATKQMDEFFSTSAEDFKQLATELSNIYSFENLENFINEPPTCAKCGQKASKKCSKCQQEWYCRRQCQVEHWEKHKNVCDLLSKS